MKVCRGGGRNEHGSDGTVASRAVMTPKRVALLRAALTSFLRMRVASKGFHGEAVLADNYERMSEEQRHARFKEPTPHKEVWEWAKNEELIRWNNGYEITAAGVAWLADRRNK